MNPELLIKIGAVIFAIAVMGDLHDLRKKIEKLERKDK